jgi:hypothetical protein
VSVTRITLIASAVVASVAVACVVALAGWDEGADGVDEARAATGEPVVRTAARRAPLVRQLVVFRSGASKASRLRARRSLVKVGDRYCAVARGTPLAALKRSAVATIKLRDYGSCRRRSAWESGGLFVRKLGPDANAGAAGWVYKVGHKLATAGAADPSGPFGSGRLRTGKRVTWFYCVPDGEGRCQRSLGIRIRVEDGGVVFVRARGYDNFGRAVLVPGATVYLAGRTALTDAVGRARFVLPPGSYKARAAKAGLIRSFSERVVVPR